MTPLLVSALLLIVSWSVAHIMAVISLLFLKQTGLEGFLSKIIPLDSSSKDSRKIVRLIYFLAIVVVFGFVLAYAAGTETVHQMLLERFTQLVNNVLTSGMNTNLLEYLILFLGIFLALQLLIIVNGVFPRIYRILNDWSQSRLKPVKIQSLELLTADQIANLLVRSLKVVKTGITLFVGSICLIYIFSFFPGREGFVDSLITKISEILTMGWLEFLAILPNLVTLVIIGIITRYTLKILRLFYDGFRKGKIQHSGFNRELAHPTFQLIRVFVFAFALVAAFPFIPGSDSPVFRGLSIFVGFLISLGSTSLVTNIISGVVLTYTRGLQIGDRVKIGNAVGDVLDRTLLVTRVRSIKNVDIIIPNGMVLSNHIFNYSAAAEETGLILHTAITIGYDVPWRQVHELLIQAAEETEHVMEFPKPFVLQTSLDDYYVSYELNAYTMKPNKMAAIYSGLHQNIQDKFNEAEIEILSPQYAAVRDGHQIAIPAEYIPKNYTPPGLRTFPIGRNGNFGG